MKRNLSILALILCGTFACAEEITLATYNVEYFNNHFLAHEMTSATVAQDPAGKEMLTELRKKNDEDNWETAEVILDPKFNPDILVIEEGCNQKDLEYFNHRWLHDAYETVIQFPTNTTKKQNLDLLMKKGFKILDRKDQYYLEPDPIGNERGGRLFARGPAFVKVQTPAGKVMWVGVTHMKSKSLGPAAPRAARAAAPAEDEDGNSTTAGTSESQEVRQRKVDITKWRNREAVRTHAIIKELEKAGPSDVILLGDMNDSVGLDRYEGEGGGDAIMNLVGAPADGLELVTKPLADQKQISFHGYWRTGFRELIDHVIVTPSLKGKVQEVRIINEGLAKVSSDHFPVVVRLKTD